MIVRQLELPLEEVFLKISKDDILHEKDLLHNKESIEVSQRFLKRLFPGLLDIPERGEKIGASCCFCEEQLVLEDKPRGTISEGEYIFRCPWCFGKFWVAMV